MSMKAMAAVADVQVGGVEKSVLLFLADQAPPEGVVMVSSLDEISRRTCWDRETVVAALASLKASGHLRAPAGKELRYVPPSAAGEPLVLVANPPG